MEGDREMTYVQTVGLLIGMWCGLAVLMGVWGFLFRRAAARRRAAIEGDARAIALLYSIFGIPIKQRWEAFWRVYRALRRADPFEDCGIAEAARAVFRGEQREWYDRLRAMQGDPLLMPVSFRLAAWNLMEHLCVVGGSER